MSDRSTKTEDRPLEKNEWRMLAVLGLPTFAYALATTVATTYLPVLAEQFTQSTTVVGMLVAIEGVMALLLAVPAGALSDRIRTRLPFVMLASPVLVLALAAMGFSWTLWFAILITTIFFAGYFVAYEPYRALYPDLVAPEIVGRAQSSQALWRGAGTVIAISSGGTLLALADWVPFVAGAAGSAVAVAVFLWFARKAPRPDHHRVHPPGESGDAAIGTSLAAVFREDLPKLRKMLRRPGITAFTIANALWEFSLGAIKTFIILYLTIGLGMSTTAAALAVTGTAVIIAIATPVSGKLADRFGPVKVMRWSLVVYAIGLLIPFFISNPAIVASTVPLFAFGGGVVMTLPYALMIPLMGDGDHGLSTGLYSVSRGVGTALGPLLAGVAIETLRPQFEATDGYQAMFGVCAIAVFLSIPLLSRLTPRSAGS